VEGTQVSGVDIVQLGGGVARKAVALDVSTTVSDGFLSIDFRKSDPAIDQPSKSTFCGWLQCLWFDLT